jgi:hypothetical protein
MGLKRIHFGEDVETNSRGKVKALASSKDNPEVCKNGYWEGQLLEAKYKVAKTGNVGIGFVFKVVDPEAVDIDGTEFTGMKQWDDIWFGEKSLKMTKLKLAGLGVDVDNLIIETEEDVQDLAQDLNDQAGLEVALVTEAEEDDYGTGEYEDGTQKYKSRVKFINELK